MKFLSDIDVGQGSEVLLGSGEYLSWGTAGVTSIEGSTAANRLRFYTSSTLSLTLDSSQNATFAGNASVTGNLEVSGGGITLGGTGRIQGIDTVLASTDAASKAYVDASAGGGGTIGGSIGGTQIAFGGTTNNEITGSSKLTFTSVSDGLGYDKLAVGDGSTGANQVLLDINTLGTSNTRGRLTLSDAGTLRGFLGITGGNEEVTLLSNDDLILSCGSGAADIIKLTTNSSERLRINYSGDVGIGDTDPASKLSVAGGIQMANDPETSNTNSDKAGTLRYREVTNIGTPKASNSYIDMYMRTGDSTYGWVNIVTSNW